MSRGYSCCLTWHVQSLINWYYMSNRYDVKQSDCTRTILLIIKQLIIINDNYELIIIGARFQQYLPETDNYQLKKY